MSELRGGLGLADRFYSYAAAPLLNDVAHAAALLGDGSEVLGFDDHVSPDHDFGPRLQIFVDDPDQIEPVLARMDKLPTEFEGWPVRFSGSFDHTPHHHVYVATASRFFADRVGLDPLDGMSAVDWLLAPTQILATMTRGAVFHDPSGALARRRAALAWYPDDVWRYVLAAAWLRISQEEAFVGRAGGAGDEFGSRVVATRVARDMMRLAFLINRVYAPYSKWLGRAFAELPLFAAVGPALTTAVDATGWREREAALNAAGEVLGRATNDLRLAARVDPGPRRFHERDIRVTPSESFCQALVSSVADLQVQAILAHQGLRAGASIGRLTGSVDQFVDSTDVLSSIYRCRQLRPLLIGKL
jgi:hypothetical protein